MTYKLTLAAMLLSLGLTAAASADTLLIQEIARDSSQRSGWPARGLTMSQVESRFGAPLNKRPPVGDPPINRWDYEEYIVFFEGDIVLHSVRRRQD
jgi:hypothetical protein